MASETNVCVTGGTGFIGSHLILALLQQGYFVRATVRNPDDHNKTAFLWNLPGAKERLEVVKADLLEEGSFDAAVSGVKGVFHTAAPVFSPSSEDPEKFFLEPCQRGTLNVLRSCAKSTSINRVVLTSSCSAVRFDYNRGENDPPLDESYWSSPEYCSEFKLWYAKAKTLSEQEAWRFSKEHGLRLVVVHPSFVIGPTLSPLPTSTIGFILSLIKGDVKDYPNIRVGFVHIDDVVAAHLIAYQDQSASGRIICSGPVYHWHQIVQMLKEKYPMYPIPTRCGEEQGQDFPHSMNTSKIEKLGLQKLKGVDEMIDDCIHSFRHCGLLT